MINVMDKTASIKASPIGQDFQDALWGKQPGGTLDVAQSIVTLKEYLVKDLSRGDKASPELKHLYPTYFDAARVLLAECAAEFFQAGCIRITALDPLRMRYREHEARRLVLTPQDIAQLLRVLRRVQEPAHGLYLRHKADTACWLGHIQAVQQGPLTVCGLGLQKRHGLFLGALFLRSAFGYERLARQGKPGTGFLHEEAGKRPEREGKTR